LSLGVKQEVEREHRVGKVNGGGRDLFENTIAVFTQRKHEIQRESFASFFCLSLFLSHMGVCPLKIIFYIPTQKPIQKVSGPNRGQITASLDSILVIYFCYTSKRQ
jgi:hypothetical protein